MNYKLLIILIFVLCKITLAQNFAPKSKYLVDSLDLEKVSQSDRSLIDSCIAIYSSAKVDSNKINAINTIVETSWDENVWAKYNFWVLQKLSSNQYNLTPFYREKILAGCLINHGYYKRLGGDIEAALSLYDSSYQLYLSTGILEGQAYCLNNMGVIFDSQGNLPKALECYQNSLDIQEQIGDKEGIANSLSNMGEVYRVQGDIDDALKYLQKALKINREINHKRGEAMSLVKIGDIYREKEKYDLALEYFEKGLKINREIEEKAGEASALRELGILYYLIKEYTKSIEYLTEAAKLFEETDDVEELTKCYSSLSSVNFNMGNYSEAEKLAKMSHEMANKLGFTNIISSTALALSSVYEEQDMEKEALNFYKLHISMKDSVRNEKNRELSIRNQLKYEYEKQKALDEKERDSQKALAKKEKQRQQIITISSVGGGLMALVFVVILINRLKVTKQQKIIIEETNEELNQTNEELAAQRDAIEEQKEIVEIKNREITDSITYAKRIQQAILPSESILKDNLRDFFVLYKPKDIVAGDFYWFEKVGNKSLFAVADCTGHGVPGAMVSVVCNNALNRAVKEYGIMQPSKILDKVNEIISQEFENDVNEIKDGMDIALCSLEGGILEFAGANNPLWILRDGEINVFDANRQPVGAYFNKKTFNNQVVELKKGDSVYIFSDGYVDQFGGERDKKFGFKNFRKTLLDIQNEDMSSQQAVLNEVINEWMSKSTIGQLDDICILGVKI